MTTVLPYSLTKRFAIVVMLLGIILFACLCGQIPTPEPGLPTATGTAVPTATNTGTFTPTDTAVPTPTPISPPATFTAVPATAEPTATELATAVPTSLPLDTYTVQRGDWLIKIAVHLYGGRHGWQWKCLYANNRAVIGADPNLIYRGQVLRGIRGCNDN